jgi:hypothetical protein
MGSSTLKKKLGEALSMGIKINGHDLRSEVHDIFRYNQSSDNPDMIEVERESNSTTSYTYESKLAGFEFPIGKDKSYTMDYEDPFKVIAGRFLARDLGKKLPELTVWPGDGISLTGSIPAFALEKLESWEGTCKNSLKFTQILGPEKKFELLMKRTHWGVALMNLIYSNSKVAEGESAEGKKSRLQTLQWAKLLRRRISDFLHGYRDPYWNKAFDPYDSSEPRPEKHRASRFLELLKTVDGIFLQCYVAVPEMDWSWEKFDMTVLKNLSALIGDEFFDGDVKVEYHNITTRYTELKRARKTFKRLSNYGTLKEALQDRHQRKALVGTWLHFFLPMWEYTRSIEDPIQLAYVDSVLSQTRGAGQPPDMVKMQSKRKFLSTVSEEPERLSDTEKLVLKAAIDQLNAELPPEIFTGLDTKARITLNANACWEKTQKDGGTLEAIAEIVTTGQAGELANVRDLFSGEIEEKIYLSEATTGTYIFWRCLDEVLKESPANLRKAALVMISEPGKARTVTKASSALKVVLDVVNKICAHPLGKIKSSASGMKKSSHAWNSFKESWTDEGKEYVFGVQKRVTESRPDGSRLVETTYKDLWCSSTDYSEATDRLRHEVAIPVAEYWMNKCGIPRILQMIVRGTCFAPRPIVFEAYGPMGAYGEEWTEDSPFRNPGLLCFGRESSWGTL